MKELIVAIVGDDNHPARDFNLEGIKERIKEGLEDGVIVLPHPVDFTVWEMEADVSVEVTTPLVYESCNECTEEDCPSHPNNKDIN